MPQWNHCKNKMKKIETTTALALLLSLLMMSCHNVKKQKNEELVTNDIQIEETTKQTRPIDNTKEICESILNTLYNNYVLWGGDGDFKEIADQMFTEKAKQKLKDAYHYDCDGVCYAVWELRTSAQDIKDENDDESKVIQIDQTGDNEFTVKYKDVGYVGETSFLFVKENGQMKIDEYEKVYDECSSSQNMNIEDIDLLYRGTYSVGPDVYPDGTSFPSGISSMEIAIYANKLSILGYKDFEFKGITQSGKRKYSASGIMYGFNQANADAFVDGAFNIEVYFYVNGIGTIEKRYTTNGSTMPIYQGGQGGFNNGGNIFGGGVDNSGNPRQIVKEQVKCSRCNGTGQMPFDTYPTMFGQDDYDVYCNICGRSYKKSRGHTHVTCTECNGTGVVERTTISR